MDALRLEKSYKLIPRELSIEYCALESGLSRFISMKKPHFYGKEGLVAWKEKGLSWKSVTLEVFDVTDADARGSEPIYIGDKLVGRATSGGYGWRINKSLALAMLAPEHAEVGTEVQISILGKAHRAVVIPECPFDPENTVLKGA